MPDFGPDILDDVVAACTEGAAAVGKSLQQALGIEGEIKVAVGSSGDWKPTELPAGFEGPGLVAVLGLGEVAALAFMPDGLGEVADESKLATLSHELATAVLPPAFAADQSRAGRVESLQDVATQAEIAEQAAMVNLSLASEGGEATMTIVWPANQPSAALGEASATSDEAPADFTYESIKPKLRDRTSLENLPDYTRSLLKVEVPVSVKLAAKKQSVDEILRLGAGSIIQFEKGCDETLEMEAGGHRVAEGEAVKVGDKFGLRITSMILPDERFQTVRRP